MSVLPSCPTQNLVYDLGDSSKWEYFFPNVDKPLLIVPPGEDRQQALFDVRTYVHICAVGRGGGNACGDLLGGGSEEALAIAFGTTCVQ